MSKPGISQNFSRLVSKHPISSLAYVFYTLPFLFFLWIILFTNPPKCVIGLGVLWYFTHYLTLFFFLLAFVNFLVRFDKFYLYLMIAVALPFLIMYLLMML